MKKLSQLLFLVLVFKAFPLTSFAQRIVVGARDEFAINASVNLPVGEKSFDGSPALMANMKLGFSGDLRYTTRVFKSIHAGAWAGYSKFSNWQSSDDPDLYKRTAMTFLSLGPALMFKPWSAKDVRSNRFSVCAVITPGVSMIKVATNPEDGVNDDTSPENLTVNSTRLTVGLQAGISYICSTSFGLNAVAGYRYTTADSQVFPDKSYSFISVGAGIFYRINLDRRYKYSHL